MISDRLIRAHNDLVHLTHTQIWSGTDLTSAFHGDELMTDLLGPPPTQDGPEAPILVLFVLPHQQTAQAQVKARGREAEATAAPPASAPSLPPPLPPPQPPPTSDDATHRMHQLEQRLAEESARTSYLEKTLARESVKMEYLQESLDGESARYRRLEESTANQLIAQRRSADDCVRERDERIAGLEGGMAVLEVENSALRGENAQMRSRCAILDSIAGQLAGAGLVPQATSTDAAADASSSTEKDARIAEGEARVVELERLLAKSRREHNQMQVRALKAEMRNPG